ncbi:MAG: hypothetical protein IT350_12525 [Deltaproteobacteria bacterium]|nr:hypothetical protein [Deltaproteobacteria bacterium]
MSTTPKDRLDEPSWRVLQRMFEPLGIKHFASELNLGYSTVAQWQEDPESLSGAGRLNPVDRLDVIRRALQDAGHADLAVEALRWSASRAGYRLVRESGLPTEHEGLLREVLRLGAEAGDVQRIVEDALRDGRIDADERRRILKELQGAQEQAARVELIVRIGGKNL